MIIGKAGDWTSGINDPKAEEEDVAADILLKFEHSTGKIQSVRDNHVKWLRSFYGIVDDLPAYKKGTGASNRAFDGYYCCQVFLNLIFA